MRRTGRGLLRVAAVALVLGFACPVAIANASLVIDRPAAGSVVGRAPAFAGTASEPGLVEISILRHGNELVEEVDAIVAKGSWISGNASPPLADGEYTAIANESGVFGSS